MRVALDTNILVYAEGLDGEARRAQACTVLEQLSGRPVVVPAQALGELFNVLVRKARWTRVEARTALLQWSSSYAVAGTTRDAIALAAGLSADHELAIWDAVVLAVASQAGCRVLLTEDMQDGFKWGGVTVVNPFLPLDSLSYL